MEPTTPRDTPFDLNTASVEALLERFPDLGLLRAEDIVSWREKNGTIETIGPLVDELGLPEEVALQLLRVATTETMAPGSSEFQLDDGLGFFVQPPELPATAAEDAPAARAEEAAALVPAAEAAAEAEGVTAEEAEFFASAPDFASDAGSQPRLATRLGLDAANAGDDLAWTGANPIARIEPEIAQAAEPEHPSERPTSVAAAKKRAHVMPAIASLALIGNAALSGFLLQVRAETQGMKAPVVTLTGEVHGLREDQAQTRTELTETKTRLEKQATKLETTIDRVEATEARQREAARVAKETAKAEAREVLALTARIGRVESRAEKVTFELDEAIKIIDSIHGHPAPTPAVEAEEKAPVAAVKRETKPSTSWGSIMRPRR